MPVSEAVVEMRGGGGVPPPKCARNCANFRNLKANVQILDRKTPPNGLPYFTYCSEVLHTQACGDGPHGVLTAL